MHPANHIHLSANTKNSVILRPPTSRFTAGVERADELWGSAAVAGGSGFTPDMLESRVNPDPPQTEFIGSAAKNPVGLTPHFPGREPNDGFFARAQNDNQKTSSEWRLSRVIVSALLWLAATVTAAAEPRIYENRLTPIPNPPPLLADLPEWVEPIREPHRFEAPILVNDEGGDLSVRAWRFSYNARGIIEMPNRLRAASTAVIMVHPWGIDDGQGWDTPEPAGAADFCTPEKNHLAARHTREVVSPFIKSLRGKVGVVLFSLRGQQDPVHRKLYRTMAHNPSDAERAAARRELSAKLKGFDYRGGPLPSRLTLSPDKPVVDYFKQFRGLDAGPKFNPAGFWDLPIPVTSDVEMGRDDVVIHDAEGYPMLRDFLRRNGVRHILLTGYATDMCYARTCAGYENLSKDFNVFLVGDATLATFPAHSTPRFATSAHIAFASIDQLITQVSWVRYEPATTTARR